MARFPEQSSLSCGKRIPVIWPSLRANNRDTFSATERRLLWKTHPCYLAVFTGLFHAWIVISTASSNLAVTHLWIWLESEYILEHVGIFCTYLSDPKTACSQLVEPSTPASITVGALSAASTGIDCYYCIYIDISTYILRRSKRQASRESANREGQMMLWSCGVS